MAKEGQCWTEDGRKEEKGEGRAWESHIRFYKISVFHKGSLNILIIFYVEIFNEMQEGKMSLFSSLFSLQQMDIKYQASNILKL